MSFYFDVCAVIVLNLLQFFSVFHSEILEFTVTSYIDLTIPKYRIFSFFRKLVKLYPINLVHISVVEIFYTSLMFAVINVLTFAAQIVILEFEF